jgi:hypothetical protein
VSWTCQATAPSRSRLRSDPRASASGCVISVHVLFHPLWWPIPAELSTAGAEGALKRRTLAGSRTGHRCLWPVFVRFRRPLHYRKKTGHTKRYPD